MRNLLLDANNKIGELDTIKAAVGKLVDPVSKALRDFEAEKSEKAGLQTVLNNTRTAYGKLRNEVADLEKKARPADQRMPDAAPGTCRHAEPAAHAETDQGRNRDRYRRRRAQIVELESNLAQRTGECIALREENQRLDERLVATEKRSIAIESDLASARQRLLVAEDEKRAHQVMLDKASSEAARISRS